jgi:hypothetical protein
VCSDNQISIQLVSIVLADSQVEVQGCLMGCNSIQIRRMLQDANHLMSESELFVRVRPQIVLPTQAPSYLMQQANGVPVICCTSSCFSPFLQLCFRLFRNPVL